MASHQASTSNTVFIVAAFNAWSSGVAANFGGVFQRFALAVGRMWISLVALNLIREKGEATYV